MKLKLYIDRTYDTYDSKSLMTLLTILSTVYFQQLNKYNS